MITIGKDIKITIDKADVSVLSDICEMARRHITGKLFLAVEYKGKRIDEIREFLRIIFDGV